MKSNPTRYSSAVGDAWMHAMFKVKYCHRIFDFENVRKVCDFLFEEACEKYGIRLKKKSFSDNHLHAILDIGMYRRSEVAKLIRGYVATKLLRTFPWLKKKYFWRSGLWNPSYYLESIGSGDLTRVERYLDKQKYAASNQRTLTCFGLN